MTFPARLHVITVLLSLALTCHAHAQSTAAASHADWLKVVKVNGISLHYLDHGSGVPVVFVHGALDDYRMWQDQVAPFSQHYRVIAYSRRYNYPNNNPNIRPDHSAIVESEDLAALIKHLKLPPAHVVGHSYGALTALFLAVNHPEKVRSLVLAEAPVVRWAQGTPKGRALYAEFINNLWKPAGDALRKGEKEQALRLTMKYFVGDDAYDKFPPDVRQGLQSNLREWQALTLSRDAFPRIPRAAVRRIGAPVLMLSAGRTLPILNYIDAQLQPLLKRGTRVMIPGATHEMWADRPEQCRRAVLAFLDKH